MSAVTMVLVLWLRYMPLADIGVLAFALIVFLKSIQYLEEYSFVFDCLTNSKWVLEACRKALDVYLEVVTGSWIVLGGSVGAFGRSSGAPGWTAAAVAAERAISWTSF